MATNPSHRFAPANPADSLGLLAPLAGTWKGHGFNLIARPDFKDKTDLYLQLNQTKEHLQFTPIGSPIPNRGFGQDDIDLFGLTYLQQISDAGADGALHIEPGIWAMQPNTVFPPDNAAAPAQLVARMATIPHGNSVLAQGIAEPFTGTPVLTVAGNQYAFSKFPSFNSTPFAVPPTAPAAPGIVINAAGSSEALTAPTVPATPFPMYDITVAVGTIAPGPFNPPFTLNTRTPLNTSPPEPPLPANINGVPMQTVINDPISLLQKDVQDLVASGHTFKGTVLNIATQPSVTFLTNPNSGAAGPKVAIALPQFSGGVENIRFLIGETNNLESADFSVIFW